MQLKDLRTSLFGFNKNDVCEYVSQLNSVYEQKLQRQKQEMREIIDDLNQKNEELNNLTSALSQDNTDLRRENDILQKKTLSDAEEINELKQQAKEMHESVFSVFENVTHQFDLFKNQFSELPTDKNGENEYDK